MHLICFNCGEYGHRREACRRGSEDIPRVQELTDRGNNPAFIFGSGNVGSPSGSRFSPLEDSFNVENLADIPAGTTGLDSVV